jgi:hypothetical protein
MVAGRAEWIERMRTRTVQDVAAALGVEAIVRGSKWTAPCPACNAERRHTKSSDKRGAVGVRPDGAGWHCFQCDTSGDALDFVAYVQAGKALAELSDSGKADVREWCSRWLGLELGHPGSGSAHRTAMPLPVAAPRPPPKPEPPPNYPPADEVAAFWDGCQRVDAVPKVAEWLASKRLSAQDVADRDLARALPPTAAPPPWARVPWARIGDAPWSMRGYLLIAPLYDAHGVWRSVLARNVIGREPKSVAATGYERRGLVLACGLARQVLATAQRPEWWPADLPLRFEVAEGEKKFCLRATLRSDAAEHAPAVFGVESGSWKAEHAARIPDGSSVFIATDADDAGAKYATDIVRSLRARIVSGAVVVELHPDLELAPNTDNPTVRVRTDDHGT